MARFNRRGLRPGSLSYDRQKEAWLNRRRALAEATAVRAKRPEAIQRAKESAAAAQRGLRAIAARRAYREQLSERERIEFNRASLKYQDQLLRLLQRYPDRVPDDVPVHYPEPHHGPLWRLYYSSRARAGTPLRD